MKHLLISLLLLTSNLPAALPYPASKEELAWPDPASYRPERSEDEKADIKLINIIFEARKSDKTIIPDTTLHEAVGFDELIHIAQYALENGANPNTRDMQDELPLDKAIRANSIQISRLLAMKGANCKNALLPLMETARYVQTESLFKAYQCLFKLFLEKGADVNAKTCIGATPLLRLLETPPLQNLEVINPYRMPKEHHIYFVRELLAQGADVGVKSPWDDTPLSLAQEKRFPGIIALLQEKLKIQSK